MINLLPDDIGSRKIFEDIQNDFELTEYMYVALGTEKEELFNWNNIDYTRMMLQDIFEITNKLESKGETVDRVISISTIFSMDDNDELMAFFNPDDGPLDDASIIKIEKFLNDNPVIKKRLISNDGKYANLIVVPLNNEIYVPLSDQLHEITNMDKYKKYKFHFGGQAYVTGAVPQMVSEEVKILLGYGVLLMSLILFFNIRNIKAVFLILLTILLSLGGMMGFMAWIHHFTGSNDFYFTMMNTSMPIVLLTIANSDGVHVLSRFFKELRRLKKKEEAIISTMKNLALPIFLTSITTSMAFLMLIFSPVGAMLGYGVTLAFGIMWAWILSNTFLVSCIKLFNWDINSKAIKYA